MMKISLFVLCTILVTAHQTLAQSQSGSTSEGPQSSSNHQPNFFGFPFPFQIPQLPFFREQREADGAEAPAEAPAASTEEHDEGHQDRFFFSPFSPSTYVSCNSTTQAGATCTSCTQALRCGGNGVGRLQQCRGFLPYCNVGRCSFFPGELCTNSTG